MGKPLEIEEHLIHLEAMANKGKHAALLAIAQGHEILYRFARDKVQAHVHRNFAMLYFSTAAEYDLGACFRGIKFFYELANIHQAPSTAGLRHLQNIANSLYEKLQENSLHDPRASYFLAALWEKNVIPVGSSKIAIVESEIGRAHV